jgi:hypothetical protein
MTHWTTANDPAFVRRIMFDFIAQLQTKLEVSGKTQSWLAQEMGVTDGEISQVLNFGRMNLSPKTMVKYARALGMKVAIVAYDDGDPNNERGPVGSEIFSIAWDKVGKPRDVWSVNANIQAVSDTYAARPFVYGSPSWKPGFSNSTIADSPTTGGILPVIVHPFGEGRNAYAGD